MELSQEVTRDGKNDHPYKFSRELSVAGAKARPSNTVRGGEGPWGRTDREGLILSSR